MHVCTQIYRKCYTPDSHIYFDHVLSYTHHDVMEMSIVQQCLILVVTEIHLLAYFQCSFALLVCLRQCGSLGRWPQFMGLCPFPTLPFPLFHVYSYVLAWLTPHSVHDPLQPLFPPLSNSWRRRHWCPQILASVVWFMGGTSGCQLS